MTLTIRTVGFEEFARGLTSELPGSLLDAIGAELKRELDGVMQTSQGLCPVDTGRLRDSGAVSDPVYATAQVFVQLSYGGDNGEVHYALIQHEVLDFEHPGGGEAKFLERPLTDWTDAGPERVLRAAAAGGRP